MERGAEEKRGGSSCFYPYLITLHPLSPYRPTCQMPFPGILIPEGECVGREHKGILSVIVRSPLNNKLINLMGMTSHTSIHTQVWHIKPTFTTIYINKIMRQRERERDRLILMDFHWLFWTLFYEQCIHCSCVCVLCWMLRYDLLIQYILAVLNKGRRKKT